METKGKNCFLKKVMLLCISYDAVKIFIIMHNPGLLDLVKRSDIEFAQII